MHMHQTAQGDHAEAAPTQSNIPFVIIVFLGAALLHQYNGLIKGTLLGLGITADLVLFTSPALLATGLWALGSSNLSRLWPTFLPLLLFAGWMVLSLVWSIGVDVPAPASMLRVFGPAFQFPAFKALDFISGCVVAFCAAALIARAHPNVVTLHFVAATVFMLAVLPYVLTNTVVTDITGLTGVEVGIITNVDYIGFGLYFANLAIIATIVAMRSTKWLPVLPAALFVAAAAFYVILISGSTQSLLAPIVVILFFIVLQIWRAWFAARYLTVVVLAALILVVTAIMAVSLSIANLDEHEELRGISRLLMRLDENIGIANSGNRGILREQAFDAFLGSPIYGLGIGGFSAISYSLIRDYPHNIVYEVLCELGLIGMLLLSWFGWRITQTIKSVAKTNILVCDILICSIMLLCISSMVSGALNDHRTLFLLLGYLAGLAAAEQPDRV